MKTYAVFSLKSGISNEQLKKVTTKLSNQLAGNLIVNHDNGDRFLVPIS